MVSRIGGPQYDFIEEVNKLTALYKPIICGQAPENNTVGLSVGPWARVFSAVTHDLYVFRPSSHNHDHLPDVLLVLIVSRWTNHRCFQALSSKLSVVSPELPQLPMIISSRNSREN